MSKRGNSVLGRDTWKFVRQYSTTDVVAGAKAGKCFSYIPSPGLTVSRCGMVYTVPRNFWTINI